MNMVVIIIMIQPMTGKLYSNFIADNIWHKNNKRKKIIPTYLYTFRGIMSMKGRLMKAKCMHFCISEIDYIVIEMQ